MGESFRVESESSVVQSILKLFLKCCEEGHLRLSDGGGFEFETG